LYEAQGDIAHREKRETDGRTWYSKSLELWKDLHHSDYAICVPSGCCQILSSDWLGDTTAFGISFRRKFGADTKHRAANHIAAGSFRAS